MTDTGSFQKDHKSILVGYWMEKAYESLAAGRSDYTSGRLSTAVRNLYYACFYALTALLLKEGRSFKKHTGVKAALHKDLIREGILEPEWGDRDALQLFSNFWPQMKRYLDILTRSFL